MSIIRLKTAIWTRWNAGVMTGISGKINPASWFTFSLSYMEEKIDRFSHDPLE